MGNKRQQNTYINDASVLNIVHDPDFFSQGIEWPLWEELVNLTQPSEPGVMIMVYKAFYAKGDQGIIVHRSRIGGLKGNLMWQNKMD